MFDADVIQIGVSQLSVDQFTNELTAQAGSQPSSNQFNLNQNIDQYATVVLNASGGILAQGTIQTPQSTSLLGSIVTNVLNTQGGVTISTPLITGVTGAIETISATGPVVIQTPVGGSVVAVSGGLGAELTVQGSSVAVASSIELPGGELTLHATNGNVQVAGRIDVSGAVQNFVDFVQYTNGGQINLTSDTGGVSVGAGGIVDVAAAPGGGSAGTLVISATAASGSFTVSGGQLFGEGGVGGQNGSFSLDVGTIPGGLLSPLTNQLDAGGFTQSIAIRDRSDSSITVDGNVAAQNFNLSADTGSIKVTGTINASGVTGGTIDLAAHGNLIIGGTAGGAGGALLTVAGSYYDDAGQGGSITLEAGDYTGTSGTAPVATKTGGTFSGTGYLDVQAGSVMNFAVANQLTTSDVALGLTTDNRIDFVEGYLHLRAPQISTGTDVQINPINGTITGTNATSSIIVEGYKVYNLTGGGGAISSATASVMANGTTFVGGTNGTAAPGYAAMQTRLFSTNPNSAALTSLAIIEPGAEMIDTNGNLTLTTGTAGWDLSTFRFGPKSAAGDLTLRASGNLIFTFGSSLTDGFAKGNHGIWQEQLMPVGSQSWSYRLISGADFSAADFRRVQPLATLIAANTGSLLLGQGAPALPTSTVTLTSTVMTTGSFFQTIRTGIGTIDIDAGQDVQLLNPVATIYTAGAQAPALANFQIPSLSVSSPSPLYPAQYSMDGGNVTISAQNNIAHYVASGTKLLASSSLELPDNWLFRQGWVNPATGQFGAVQSSGSLASTSWWVDFVDFFEGIGALGGGNVTLNAGHNITNVDAVVPTNARMTYQTSTGNLQATNQTLLELGGGDLLVKAGGNISGGVYYVERGQGVIESGNDIFSNSTRATLVPAASASQVALSAYWLPTTLFLGEGSFDVNAGGSVLLGSVANPFMLPQSTNNSFQDRTYFSTYAESDAVEVSSLAGNVTIENDTAGGEGSLVNWVTNMDLTANGSSWAATSEPWLGSFETSIPSATALAVMPPTLQVAAFSGNINIAGTLILSPAPNGTLELGAAGSVNGVQPNGVLIGKSTTASEWDSSVIDVSDANPNSIPGIFDPASYPSLAAIAALTNSSILAPYNLLFNDSGSTINAFGVLQTQEALHAPGLLHLNDPNPVYISAASGDISGFTLYSPKMTDIVAGRDITDVALYIQNNNATDASVISAGRDIIPYNPNSPLRTEAQEGNNVLSQFTLGQDQPGSGTPNAGDIQIAGPGTLEILAGRNFTLGVGPNNVDDTGLGVTSIGNAANPYLPFAGASIDVGAGLGDPSGLAGSPLGFSTFIGEFLNPATGGAEATRYLPDLGSLLSMGGASDAQVWSAFEQLSPEQQDINALSVFYLVLRDAGRDHNDASSPDFGNYAEGYDALAALFPGNQWNGDIDLTSREVKTESGGYINMFDPGGELTVGLQINGVAAVEQGILTQDGGNISIFTQGNVNVGSERIFTLRGGNEIIWSTDGNIAAGASSKTVQSAPPTRVLVDPQSATVETDLSGLATGGGIGVLATVTGVPVGDVDLVAPNGVVDAGDAGIRATGNLNIAAVQVLNASNISVGGASVGTPAAAAAPNVAGLSSGNASQAATNSAANDVQKNAASNAAQAQQQETPSDINVEVLGYGGGDGGVQSQNDDPRKKKPGAAPEPADASRVPIHNAPPLAMSADAARK